MTSREFKKEIGKSTLIIPCIEADDGINVVIIGDKDNKAHLPLFTYVDDVFPQAYYFKDLLKVAREDFVINPSTESVIINPEMFKK